MSKTTDLGDYLMGLTIGTPQVPVLEVGNLKPLTSNPADPRRTLTVELLIQDGAGLTREKMDQWAAFIAEWKAGKA